ncbi:MAG: geranylgeranyl reductase family protein [Methanotrichaceae archaeon]|jgi:geranylgeranyl reductase family protein
MYDLIIAGAGPAGSSAAREAGKAGMNVLLIDKDRFPRYKPCGGGLSERALFYLDFSLPENICERSITGARIRFGDRVIDRHKDYRLTVTLTRSIFDDFLLKKAQEIGVHVATGKKVLDFREDSEKVEVRAGDETYRSKYLIVAAGSQNRLKERVRDRDGKDRYGICMVTEVPEKNDAIDARLGNALEFHFGVARMGYGWIFPHDGYYSVGIGGMAKDMSNPRRSMIGFLRKNGFAGSYKLRGHLIPFGGITRPVASPRVLLSGDSAGFVDSFTGEGIAYAIKSGQNAAQTVADKLEDDDLDLAESYQQRCKKDFGDDLKYSLIMAKIMHSWPEMFFRMLATRDDFLDKFLEVPAMKGTYKSLIRWLMPRMPGYLLSI